MPDIHIEEILPVTVIPKSPLIPTYINPRLNVSINSFPDDEPHKQHKNNTRLRSASQRYRC